MTRVESRMDTVGTSDLAASLQLVTYFFFRLAFVYIPRTYIGDIEIGILMLLSINLSDLNGGISDVLDCGGIKKLVLKRDVCRSRTTKPISYRCVRLQ